MATVFIDRMAVEREGRGEAVMLVHGLGGSSNTWSALGPVLARHEVVRPDLPGSGRSAGVPGPLSIGGFVDALLRVLDGCNLSGVHLVGHSLGTIVALHLAARHPARVRSLALFGPLLAPPDGARAAIRARAEKARAGGIAAMQEIADALVQASTSAETKARRPAALAFVRESLMRQSADGYARTCEALADAQAADVSRIACPTLLVTGDEDAVAPPQSVRLIGDRIRTSRLEVLRGCGHWTPIEMPEACAALLAAHLSRPVRQERT
jgi:pimeloyl-ACP methyl ester carboxylesterase